MDGGVAAGLAAFAIGPELVAVLWVVVGLIFVRLGRREERAWVVEQQQLLVLVIRAELESQSEPASCV